MGLISLLLRVIIGKGVDEKNVIPNEIWSHKNRKQIIKTTNQSGKLVAKVISISCVLWKSTGWDRKEEWKEFNLRKMYWKGCCRKKWTRRFSVQTQSSCSFARMKNWVVCLSFSLES